MDQNKKNDKNSDNKYDKVMKNLELFHSTRNRVQSDFTNLNQQASDQSIQTYNLDLNKKDII